MIKKLHEPPGLRVINGPLALYDTARACRSEGPGYTDNPLAAQHGTKAGFTGRQGNEFGIQRQVVNFTDIEALGVWASGIRRKHEVRIIAGQVVRPGVRSQVQHRVLGNFPLESRFSGLGPDPGFSPGQLGNFEYLLPAVGKGRQFGLAGAHAQRQQGVAPGCRLIEKRRQGEYTTGPWRRRGPGQVFHLPEQGSGAGIPEGFVVGYIMVQVKTVGTYGFFHQQGFKRQVSQRAVGHDR